MDPDFVYNSECYLQKRGSIHKGFGGNYRRASDSFTVTSSSSSSSATGSDSPKHLHSGLKSFSFCHRNCRSESSNRPSSISSSSSSYNISITNQSVPTTIKTSDHHWEKTLIVYGEKKSKDIVTSHQTNPSVGKQGLRESKEAGERRFSATGNRELLPLLMEDETSSVSVMECIKSFEHTDQKQCTAVDDKPKLITRTRVAELRETILRRSSENLADTSCSSNPSRINKRPVSAVLECSFGTFPKIPISTIQRRSIGTLFQSPISDEREFLPNSGLSLFHKVPVKHEQGTDKNKQENNSVPMRSFMHNLEQKDQKGLKRRSNIESCDTATAGRNISCDRRSDAEGVSGVLVKTDSLDSGIDTRADCLGNRTTVELESFPEDSSHPATSLQNRVTAASQTSHSMQEKEYDSTSQNLMSKERGSISEVPTKPVSTKDLPRPTSSLSVFLNLESDEFAQISSEEIHYKELVVRVLSQLKEQKEDFSLVLLPSNSYRTSFYYMVDIIKEVKIPDFWVNLSTGDVDISEHPRADRSFHEDLLQLLNCVKCKIEAKRQSREDIKHKISERKDSESQISNIIRFRVEKKKYEKYCLYLTELDKVLRLMFMLASRLASTENSLATLRTEEDVLLVKMLSAKQASLIEKLEDAKLLKDGIDRRSEVVNSFLKLNLSESEYAAYQQLVSTTIRLHFVHQWIEDCLELYERQMNAVTAIHSYSSSIC